MADLTLRRQSSRFIHPWDRDRFWEVVHHGSQVGYMVLTTGNSENPPRWEWSIHLHAGVLGNGLPMLAGSEESREAAMAAFRISFDRCIAQIGKEGWALHLEHMARLGERAGTNPTTPG